MLKISKAWKLSGSAISKVAHSSQRFLPSSRNASNDNSFANILWCSRFINNSIP